ncbi:MAG: hypothetical protein R3E77_14595 [Steroidobacteraceae bacterium]
MFALALGCAVSAADGREEYVLVTPVSSRIESVDPIEVRKLFLGLPVARNGRIIRAIRHTDGGRMDEVFLQNVTAMSERAYDHRLLTLGMQQGRLRPLEVKSREELLKALRDFPHSIAFARRSDVGNIDSLRILRVIWKN